MTVTALSRCAAIAAVSFALAAPSVVAAQDVSGLAAMHDLRREGKKLCMADHWHYGSSSGERSQKAAVAAAAYSWSSFTDLEYGREWASFAKANGKSVKCQPGSSGWGCEVSARPCR
jgi:hypothetical protein